MRLSELAPRVGAALRGSDIEITGVASIAGAAAHDLVFAQDEVRLAAALGSRAGAVLAGEFARAAETNKPLLIAAHPRLAFALAGELLAQPAQLPVGIHPNAQVHSSARLGNNVGIAPFVVIGPNAVLGNGCH